MPASYRSFIVSGTSCYRLSSTAVAPTRANSFSRSEYIFNS